MNAPSSSTASSGRRERGGDIKLSMIRPTTTQIIIIIIILIITITIMAYGLRMITNMNNYDCQ